MRIPILILSLVLAATQAVRGQDAPSRADIEQAARDLGHASFQTRKQARTLLAGVGWEAKAELEKAAANRDPEVADVARQLLAEMLPGVTRQTPAEQRKLVARYARSKSANTRQSCVKGLVQAHPFPRQLLLGLLESESERLRQDPIVKLMLGAAEQWLPPMLEQGDASVYEYLLQQAVRIEAVWAIPRIAAYALHRGKLAAMREQVADVVAKKPTRFSRRLLVELHVLAGERAEAVAAAKGKDDATFLQQLLVRTCDWDELAKLQVEKMGEMNGLQRFQLAAVQRLAGQDKLAAETLAALAGEGKKDGVAKAADGQVVQFGNGGGWVNNQFGAVAWQGWGGELGMAQQVVIPQGMFMGHRNFASPRHRRSTQKVPAWRCLLAYGLTADAIRGLEKSKGSTRVTIAEILLMQNRYAEADRLFRQEIADAKPPNNWLLAVRRSGFLCALGDDTAAGASKELLEHFRKGEKEVANSGMLYTAAKAITEAGFRELLVDPLPELMLRFEGTEENNARRLVPYLAPVQCSLVASFWWSCLAKGDPEASLVSRATRLRDFLHGRLSAEETQKVLRMALHPEAPVKERVSGLAMVARTCARLGRQEEAEAAYRLALRFAAEAKDRALQDSVWNISYDVFVPSEKWQELMEAQAGLASRGRMNSLAVQGTLLAWMGRHEEAKAAVDRALLATCVGREMVVLPSLLKGQWPAGLRRVLPLVEASTACPSVEALEGARAIGDYALELRLAQRAWYYRVCSPQSWKEGPLLMANANLASAQCRALVAEGKLAEVLAKAKQVADAFPNDIDGAADTVEALDRAGAKVQGDALVAHVLAREQKVLDKLPNAVQHLNSIAWMCARTGRQLNRGEICILKAIEREPRRDDFLDTLAVLRSRKGDMAGALVAARKSLRIDFADYDYLHQLGRWLSEQK